MLREIPDKEAMEQSITDFLERFAKEERGSYRGLHTNLSLLPMPGKVDQRGLSVTKAIGAGMIQRMEEEEALRFTPTEVLLSNNSSEFQYCLWYILCLYSACTTTI